jgi:hypothetical protein
MGNAVTDINFDSQGRLWAYYNTNNDMDVIGTVNIATGDFTEVGPTDLNDIGNGIAFARFLEDNLYHAGSLDLSILSKVDGSATTVASPIVFLFDEQNNPRINAMDTDFFFNYTYASLNNKPLGMGSMPENFLSIINRNTGEVHLLTDPAVDAPDNLDGIAINRVYEVCDQGGFNPDNEPPIPIGALCDNTCHLTESDCTDGEDNDLDGLTDCEDPDCNLQACDDGNQCTGAGQCVSGTCEPGQTLPDGTQCNDENPCTGPDTCVMGTCQGPDFDEGQCDDEDPCTIDQCVGGVCDSSEIDVGASCDDDEECTSPDTCQVDGSCEGPDVEDGTTCDDGNSCTIDTCQEGMCEGEPPGEEICNNGIDDDCDGLIDGDDPDCEVLFVFATSTLNEGDFGEIVGGLVAADNICNALAANGGLSGTFVAFLSDKNTDAADRITADGPWHLANLTVSNGTKVADNKADLLDGTIDTAINVNELGNDVSPGNNNEAWTGSDFDGTYSGEACDANDTGADWVSNDGDDKGTAGSINSTGQGGMNEGKWSTLNEPGCNNEKRLYCFQVGP